MPQLSYAVDKDQKRLRLYFDETNPVESALLKHGLVKFKMYGYKIPGTSLICIEVAITDSLVAEFDAYLSKKETQTVKTKPGRKRKKVSKEPVSS